MDIRTGDYVTLKSVEEVKPIYEFWDVTNDGNVITDTEYFSTNMLDAMGSSNKYRVLEANQDGIWIDIEGKMWGFDKMCIKDVYKLVKVS
jgi:hypothetical protein